MSIILDEDNLRLVRIEQTKQVAYDHMAAIIPAYNDEDIINLHKKMIQSNMISLPTANSDMDKCVQIWDYFVAQRTWLETEVNISLVDAYDPVADVNWPF